MSRIRKYGVTVLVILALLIGTQVAASFVGKSRRMRSFMLGRVASAFGRPVEAADFSIQILPLPEVQMDHVTIGEDPAFGREYFLRADRMNARLRWMGLLGGRLEFGTMSLTRPSLILVRNAEGRWNLEGWLPPAHPSGPASSAATGAPEKRAGSTHRLETIEFDEGRINFKMGDEKRAFAFINVSGRLQQVAPGRWRLRLEAEPWRSGVQLQSTGTLQVVGDVAGTSARLQPAQIQIHWAKVSLADLFRLVTGNDSGVRGEFALDGKASVGTEPPPADTGVSDWKFELHARATELHRWDLTERKDNPRININLKGLWNRANDRARAEELRVELPHSNLVGAAMLQTASPAAWQAQFKTMAIQGEDLLTWYRAFQPGMAEGVTIRDLITGNVTVSGWPLRLDDGVIESRGGTLQVPELKESRIEPFHAAVRNGKLSMDALRLKLGVESAAQNTKARFAATPEDSLDLVVSQDSLQRQGNARLNLRLAEASRFFKLTSAFGRRLDQGWEYGGGATGFFAWNWGGSSMGVHRNGSIELTKSRLAIVGLNEPLKVEESRIEWKDGRRSVTIGKAEAFGANWAGSISEVAGAGTSVENHWRFQLHADKLDAAELDRWFGPRGRPNWLQRLLPSLLGQSASTNKASELLRRVSAEGELSADVVSVEKIKLAKARASLALHQLQLEVRNAEAQWAGGNVQGEIMAEFSPVPHYEVMAEVDRANLAQLPWPERWAERWSGTCSGTIRLNTSGVGREELLKELAGEGEVQLSKIELRGWDVRASTEAGVARAGTSRWTGGAGRFEIGEQEVRFDAIQLEGPQARTQLSGTLGFDMSGDVTFRPGGENKPGTKLAQASRGLSLSGPLETPKVAVEPVSEETARP